MKKIASILKNKEIMNRIMFTVLILFIFRIGAQITVPGVNPEGLEEYLNSGSALSLMNLLGGGTLQTFSIFALGFEGGQMPLWRRLPKRGFKNVNRVNYAAVNVGDLNNFKDGTVVTPALLHEAGLVRKDFDGIKVLGGGKLERKLTVQANAFSQSAKDAIEALGGVAELIKR